MKKLLLSLLMAFMVSGMAFATVNVNTADQKTLESVKGIGPVKANAIIDYRNKHGRFKTIEDLDKVPGIGKGTLKEVRSQVATTGPNTPIKATTTKSTTKSKMAPAKPGANAGAAAG